MLDSDQDVFDTDPIKWVEEHSAGSSEFSLSEQGLGFAESKELPPLIKAISADVKRLDLSNNDFEYLTNEELADIFTVISGGVTFLDLSDNGLDDKTQEEKDFIFANIPKTVITIKLGFGNYYRATPSELRQAAVDTNAGLSDEDVVLWLQEKSAGLRSFSLKNKGLGYIEGPQLAMSIGAISPSVQRLDLSDNDLSKQTNEDLVTAFAVLPAGVVLLNLSGNGLDKKTKKEKDLIFSKLPKTVTLVMLGNGKYYKVPRAPLVQTVDINIDEEAQAFADSLPNVTTESVVKLISEHSAGQTSYDLSDKCLGFLSGSTLADYIAGISDSVTELDLSLNSFFELTDADLETALAPLSHKGVTSLDLSGNGFDAKTQDKIIKMLPPSITITFEYPLSLEDVDSELDIEREESGASITPRTSLTDEVSSEDTAHAFDSESDDISLDESSVDWHVNTLSDVRASLVSVDLGANDLGDKSNEELNQLLDAINEGVTSIDLSANGLYKKDRAILAAALMRVKTPVTLLDLSDNCLGRDKTADLAVIFAAASKIAESLILANNKLNKQSNTKLSEALSVLSDKVRFLDLSENGLELKSDVEKELIFSKVPKTVTVIKLGKGNFYRGSEADLDSLSAEHINDRELISMTGSMLDDTSFVKAADDTSFTGTLDDTSSIDWSEQVLQLARKAGHAVESTEEISDQDSTEMRASKPSDKTLQDRSRQATSTKRIPNLSAIFPNKTSVNLVAGMIDDETYDDSSSSDSFESQSLGRGSSDTERLIGKPTALVEAYDDSSSRNSFESQSSGRGRSDTESLVGDPTVLDLSGQSLGYESSSNVIAYFSGSHTSLLDLSNNYLGNPNIDDLCTTLSKIPASVTHLDLSMNGLEYKSNKKLARAFQAIPETVNFICFDKATGFVPFNKDDFKHFEERISAPENTKDTESVSASENIKDAESTNYSFAFDCLGALAAVGALVALVALVALIVIVVHLAPSIATAAGIGVATAAVVAGVGYAAHGFFSGKSGESKPSVQDEPTIDPSIDSIEP